MGTCRKDHVGMKYEAAVEIGEKKKCLDLKYIL